MILSIFFIIHQSDYEPAFLIFFILRDKSHNVSYFCCCPNLFTMVSSKEEKSYLVESQISLLLIARKESLLQKAPLLLESTEN
jgi:hypothetical protein